jgi:glutamine synthetase type III
MSIHQRRQALAAISSREAVEQEEKVSACDLTEIWESDCYGLQAMRETLPSHCYKKLREVINSGKELDHEIAGMHYEYSHARMNCTLSHMFE